MGEGYYCSRCNKFVLPLKGFFIHPHIGETPCLVCPKCGTMVYLRKQEGAYA